MKEKNKDKKPALSRKDAMKKMGLSAFSAATMMLLLNNPVKGQYDSPPIPPDEW